MALSTPIAAERGKYVLDCVHPHRAFANGGGALDRF